MNTIFVLFENTDDRVDEAVCWHTDGPTLEAEAMRREWAHYESLKAMPAPPGYLVFSPDECEYRRFTVVELPRFEPEPLDK